MAGPPWKISREESGVTSDMVLDVAGEAPRVAWRVNMSLDMVTVLLVTSARGQDGLQNQGGSGCRSSQVSWRYTLQIIMTIIILTQSGN